MKILWEARLSKFYKIFDGTGVGVLGLYSVEQTTDAFSQLETLCNDVQKDTGII